MTDLGKLRTGTLSRTKRFLERCVADARLRQDLRDGRQSAYLADMVVDPNALRFLWDPEYKSTEAQPPHHSSPLVQEYLSFRKAKFDHSERVRLEGQPDDMRFRAWRERQIQRVSLELPFSLGQAIVHPVFACELSEGCSVGCWFCGVSASKLQSYFPYTSENAVLWQQTLLALRSKLGATCGRWGFLYWATDPFDNPDYEKFCLDFREVFGQFPHTTTAKALEHPERTRRFLQLSEKDQCFQNRFSVLSLGILDRLHKEFTPEELTFVELVSHNKGSLLPKLSAGRARERAIKSLPAQLPGSEAEAVEGETIACVSGFLLNMVAKSIKLISPCAASDRWPLGYRIHDQQKFHDASELAEVVSQMIRRNMPPSLPDSTPLAFRPGLEFAGTNDGFALFTKHGQTGFHGTVFLREVGELICEGCHTVKDIAHHVCQLHGIEVEITTRWIDRIFAEGVLEEEIAQGERAFA